MKDSNALLQRKWPEKIQAFNGIRTHDLCVTGAMIYQLSYQSHMGAVVSCLPIMAAFASFII